MKRANNKTLAGNFYFRQITIAVFAIIFTLVIFLIDIYAPETMSIGPVYCIIILYSWLLPGFLSELLVAMICSVLVLVSMYYSNIPTDQAHTAGINPIISIISIWVCATLVSIAKKSLSGLKKSNKELNIQIAKFEAQTIELNNKVSELREEQQKTSMSQQKLRLINTDLKLKNEELEQFAYVASHDLQEPLRTIMNFSEILTREYSNVLDETGVKSLEFMQEASQKMSNKLTDMLAYSQLGQTRKFEEINCNKLIEELLGELETSISKSKATINYEQLPTVTANPHDLKTVFQNLINNALKFQKPGRKLQISINSEPLEDYTQFCVEDNGTGIDPKYFERIFVIFQRVHPDKEINGSGIGLSICKKIIESHGGKMWVESEPGNGSKFYFTISKLITNDAKLK